MQEITELCPKWREQNDSLLKARDTLIVWRELADGIGQRRPNFSDLSTVMQIVNKSREFDVWFDENKDRINRSVYGFSLDLGSLCLTSLPQIGEITGLCDLNLSNNLFTTIPECICQFPNLKSVWLYDNFLTSIPQSVITQMQSGQLEYHGIPASLLEQSVKDEKE